MESLLGADDPTLHIVFASSCGVLLIATLVLLVLWLGSRRRAHAAVRGRAEAERDRLELELTLAEQVSRLRMIREQHEVAVRSVSAIIASAEGARYAATQDPEVAARSAAAIEDAARAAVAELRRVATVASGGEAEAVPELDLSSIEELVGVMRDAGLGVELVERGERLELRDGAELAVFRILQEALGNALAHGGEGTTATVTLSWTEDGLQLLVEDDGIRAAAIRNGLDPYVEAQQHSYTVEEDLAALTHAPSGRGITEMRERAELFGGVFETHSVPGVGFTVQAVFPSIRYHNGVHGVPLDRR